MNDEGPLRSARRVQNKQSQALNPGLYKLHLLFFVAIVLFAALMAFMDSDSLIRGQKGTGFGLVGVALAPLAAAHWFAARGAKLGASYGRIISRIIGSIWLLVIPIGTAFGIYVWSKTSDVNWVDAQVDALK